MRRASDSRKHILPDGYTLEDQWVLDDFRGGQNGGVDIQVLMLLVSVFAFLFD